MNFKVIDNFIPLPLQEEIKSNLLGGGGNRYSCPWFYTVDVTYGVDAKQHQRNPCFSYVYKENDVVSPLLPSVAMLGHLGATAVEYQYKDILQARAFIQLPLSKEFLKTDVDLLHVDTDLPHLVVLYYVIDSDGDTLLTDLEYKQGQAIQAGLRAQDHNIIARVTPKQGSALIFNGKYYHTAEQPKYNARCCINLAMVQ